MRIETIGIIGGKGAMGCWFHRFFEAAGFRVSISDLDTAATSRDLALSCDCVVLSTPITAAVALAGEIGPLLGPGQILMDFCSQKEAIVEAMTASSTCQSVGTHPLFGPFTESLTGQNIILCPGRGTRALDWARELFISGGAHVAVMDAPAHDRHMALVQGLTHLVSIAMARTLQKMDLHPADVFGISTPIFRLNADIMGRLFAQDPDLYTTLVGGNRYVPELLELFKGSLEEGVRELLGGDHASGVSFLTDIGSFLGDYREKALERSNEFLNIILK
jgi:prephenate dehydrogenase